MFKQESLEELRRRIDLVDVLSSYVDMKRAGAYYKACCPFHDEKTPSFVVQKGDSHYHCFGCGAHGDAIAFLMSHLKLSFSDAVENLAERFHVHLDTVEGRPKEMGPSKQEMRGIMQETAEFYHGYLLHTDEGHAALEYLYKRGIDLDFVRLFQIGLAPRLPQLFHQFVSDKKWDQQLLQRLGLLTQKLSPFFSDRILFPITDGVGNVTAFSGRKMREETFGPKYINSPESPLFKKSQTLYGLAQSRKRIAKERKAIVVEGQIDALRLIQEGFNFTVAGQGTAFGEEQASQLVKLGAHTVYLLLDGDQAGRAAAVKIGNLFQKEGVAVQVAKMPSNTDPDTLLNEKGPPAIVDLMETAVDYLAFYYGELCQSLDPHSPSGKNEIVQTMIQTIRAWDHPLMIHESLRRVAELTQVPEKLIGIEAREAEPVFIQQVGSVRATGVDPNRILETDLLRWLLLVGPTDPSIGKIAEENLNEEYFRVAVCRRIFKAYLEHKPDDFLSLAAHFDHPEDQLFLSEILQKRVNPSKAIEGMCETVQKILERHWMESREEIRRKIQQGGHSDEEMLELARAFDKVKGNPPQVIHHEV